MKNFGLKGETLIRLAINPDFTTDEHDPRNAVYLVPLDDENEALAQVMADAVYDGALYELEGAVLSEAENEALWRQSLIDSRRQVLDQEYAALFSSVGEPSGDAALDAFRAGASAWYDEAMGKLKTKSDRRRSLQR